MVRIIFTRDDVQIVRWTLQKCIEANKSEQEALCGGRDGRFQALATLIREQEQALLQLERGRDIENMPER